MTAARRLAAILASDVGADAPRSRRHSATVHTKRRLLANRGLGPRKPREDTG